MNTPKIQHIVYMNKTEIFHECGYEYKCYKTIDTIDGSEHLYYRVFPNRTCDQICAIDYEKGFTCCKDNSIFVY